MVQYHLIQLPQLCVCQIPIQEVLLHSAVYCGMPAGIEAFRAAEEAILAWQAEND